MSSDKMEIDEVESTDKLFENLSVLRIKIYYEVFWYKYSI